MTKDQIRESLTHALNHAERNGSVLQSHISVPIEDVRALLSASIADTAGAKQEPDELRKLIMTLRERADSDEMAASEIDPLHYTPDEPESLAMGLEFLARERRECADVLEQQAAVIAEQGRKIADYIVELEARAALASPAIDTAGAKPVAQVSIRDGFIVGGINYGLPDGKREVFAAPPAPSSDTAGAKVDAWTDDDSGAMQRAIQAFERIESGITEKSDDRLLASPPARKMTIRDAQTLAAIHRPILTRLLTKIDDLTCAAPPAPSVADAAGASDDKALLDYLDNEENPVDTIYFDDGKIIDVAGRRTAREAIRAAIAKESK